jgi:prepilin-type processing-associated H-X9-DG protein
VPSGSNVLYMDGHVAFVRYREKIPLGMGDPWIDLNLTWIMTLLGGQR